MTLQEFKSWFSGYTEEMDSAPNEKQWKRIKDRVAQIDGTQTTVHHFHDYYYRPYWPPHYPGWTWSGTPFIGSVGSCNAVSNTALPAQDMTQMASEILGQSQAVGNMVVGDGAFMALGVDDYKADLQ